MTPIYYRRICGGCITDLHNNLWASSSLPKSKTPMVWRSAEFDRRVKASADINQRCANRRQQLATTESLRNEWRQARNTKDYQRADEIRTRLMAMGQLT